MKFRFLAVLCLSLTMVAVKAEEVNVDSLTSILVERIKSGKYDMKSNLTYTVVADYLRRTEPLDAINFHYKMLRTSEKYDNDEFTAANYVSLGTIYRDQGLNGRSMENIYHAMKYLDESHHGNFCWLYVFMGNVYFSEGLYNEAIDFYRIADIGFDSLGRLGEKITDQKDRDFYWSYAGKAVSNNNIALCYRDLNNFDSAMYYFRRGLLYRNKQKHVFGIGHSKLYIGDMYLQNKQYDSALATYNFALKMLDSAYFLDSLSKVEIKVNYSNCLFKIGTVYEELGAIGKAENFMLESLDSMLQVRDKNNIAMRYLDLSQFYMRQNKTGKSIDYARKALDISIKYDFYAPAQEAAFNLYKLYRKLRRYDDAFHYTELYYSIIDSIHNKFNKFSIQEVASRIDNEKKLIDLEKDKVVRESNIRQQQIIIISLSVLVVVVFLGILLLRKKLNIIRGLNQSLEEKNEQLVDINKKLSESERNLADVNSELNLINKDLIESENNLKEINATKDKFFSIIAHDLKNPFSSFKNVLDLLNSEYEKLEDDDRRDFIAELAKSSLFLYNLLENLLTWSRSQRGKIEFNPEYNSLKRIIDSSNSFLQMHAAKKEIQLISELDDDLYATFDANMMLTIIRNLTSNAIKFTPHHGTISIGAETDGKTVRAFVKDTGVGMPPEMIEKLFRIDVNMTSVGTDNEKGTGLGLILCKEFIDMHGGSIRVESEVDKGSVFYFEFPSEQNNS